MSKLRKTIRAKIHSLTGIKNEILRREYDKFQDICQEVSLAVDWDFLPDKPYKLFSNPERYSSYVWGAIRTISRKKQFTKIGEQPLYLRNDTFKVVENENSIAKHWLKLPTKEQHGGVWLPLIIPAKYNILLNDKICDSKITKDRKGNWYAHITIECEVPDVQIPSNPTIIAVDLGERYIATTVSVAQDGNVSDVRFCGKEVRGIRRHYDWLRKRLGNKKLLKKIKEIEQTEKRKVRDVLHKISRAIVDDAKEKNAVILLGDLKGIRNSAKGKGRRFNRIVSNMSYHTLTQFITYKAEWDGVPVIIQSERGTSSTCHKCCSKGKRLSQARFKCHNCGLDYFNADVNGAINQGRGLLATWGETEPTGLALNFGVEVIQ